MTLVGFCALVAITLILWPSRPALILGVLPFFERKGEESGQWLHEKLVACGTNTIVTTIQALRKHSPLVRNYAYLPLVLRDLGEPAHRALLSAIDSEPDSRARVYLISALQRGFSDYSRFDLWLTNAVSVPSASWSVTHFQHEIAKDFTNAPDLLWETNINPEFLRWWATNKTSYSPQRIGSVKISFLNEGPVLDDTDRLLEGKGVAKDSLALFQKAVATYNSSPPKLKLDKFPGTRNGIYSFESIYRLVAALPHKLCDTEHSYEMNCFDTMFILLNHSFQPDVRIDEISTPFPVPHYTTTGDFEISQAETPRKAFMLVYPEWYRDATDKFFPKSMADARVCFTACLFRYHALPAQTSEEDLGNEVFRILRSFWKKQNLKFPTDMEVVLCHDVALTQNAFVTVHASLLLREQNHYIYLEKAGGKGPYLRLDLENKADLFKWLAKTFTGPEARKLGFTHHFVTFNDQHIEVLKEE